MLAAKRNKAFNPVRVSLRSAYAVVLNAQFCAHLFEQFREDRTPTRQVVFFKGRVADAPETYTQKMKKKIDTAEGRSQYSRRLGIVEPVFAHICNTLGLRRFSLRGRIKVDMQWKLYCIVHNLIKIHRFGFASG